MESPAPSTAAAPSGSDIKKGSVMDKVRSALGRRSSSRENSFTLSAAGSRRAGNSPLHSGVSITSGEPGDALKALQADRASLAAQATTLQRELQAARGEAARLQSELTRAREANEVECSEALAQVMKLKSQLFEAQSAKHQEVTQLGVKLMAKEQELIKLQEAAGADTITADDALLTAHAEVALLQGTIAELQGRQGKYEAEAAAHAEAMAQGTAKQDSLATALTEAEAQVTAAQERAASAERKHAEVQCQLAQAEATVAVSKDVMNQMKADIVRVLAENKHFRRTIGRLAAQEAMLIRAANAPAPPPKPTADASIAAEMAPSATATAATEAPEGPLEGDDVIIPEGAALHQWPALETTLLADGVQGAETISPRSPRSPHGRTLSSTAGHIGSITRTLSHRGSTAAGGAAHSGGLTKWVLLGGVAATAAALSLASGGSRTKGLSKRGRK